MKSQPRHRRRGRLRFRPRLLLRQLRWLLLLWYVPFEVAKVVLKALRASWTPWGAEYHVGSAKITIPWYEIPPWEQMEQQIKAARACG